MNYNGLFVFNENFLKYLNVKCVVERGGFMAVGLLYIVCSYLKHCKNTIGLTSDLRSIARVAHVHERNLRKWMGESRLFVVDDELGVFYFPTYRHHFKLADNPSDDELRDLVENGNVYKSAGRGKKSVKCVKVKKTKVAKNKKEPIIVHNSSNNQSLNSKYAVNKEVKSLHYSNTAINYVCGITTVAEFEIESEVGGSPYFLKKDNLSCIQCDKSESSLPGVNSAHDDMQDCFKSVFTPSHVESQHVSEHGNADMKITTAKAGNCGSHVTKCGNKSIIKELKRNYSSSINQLRNSQVADKEVIMRSSYTCIDECKNTSISLQSSENTSKDTNTSTAALEKEEGGGASFYFLRKNNLSCMDEKEYAYLPPCINYAYASSGMSPPGGSG